MPFLLENPAPDHHTLMFENEKVRVLDTRTNDQPPPEVLWGGSLGPHSVENLGDTDLHVIGVEVK